jgi:hypothetical protein
VSVIATALKHLIAAGVSGDDLVRAVAEMEDAMPAAMPSRSKAADRQARYRERQASQTVTERHETSQTVTTVTPPLSPSPPPPDPPHPAPIPVEIYIPRAKGPTQTEIARGFLAFWAAYPKRVGKDAAAKSFAGAMKRIQSAEPLAVILAGLERALPGWDDPQFIPNPATWLNQGRWEDDAPTPRTGTRNDRTAPDHRSDARSVWADIIADSDGPRTGPAEPLRLAG